MRLSCNFVNVYTIAYHAQWTDIKRDDPRAEVGEDVRVSVGARVGAVECHLFTQNTTTNSVIVVTQWYAVTRNKGVCGGGGGCRPLI